MDETRYYYIKVENQGNDAVHWWSGTLEHLKDVFSYTIMRAAVKNTQLSADPKDIKELVYHLNSYAAAYHTKAIYSEGSYEQYVSYKQEQGKRLNSRRK